MDAKTGWKRAGTLFVFREGLEPCLEGFDLVEGRRHPFPGVVFGVVGTDAEGGFVAADGPCPGDPVGVETHGDLPVVR